MKPVQQTQFGAPVRQGDEWVPPHDCGDCFRACLASILELPLEDVPHFCAMPGDYWTPLQKWLQERGLFAMEIEGAGQHIAPLPAGIDCIMSGKSPRGEWSHAVCAKTVPAMTEHGEQSHTYVYTHDPHPSQDYLDSVESILFLVRPA